MTPHICHTIISGMRAEGRARSEVEAEPAQRDLTSPALLARPVGLTACGGASMGALELSALPSAYWRGEASPLRRAAYRVCECVPGTPKRRIAMVAAFSAAALLVLLIYARPRVVLPSLRRWRPEFRCGAAPASLHARPRVGRVALLLLAHYWQP